MTLRVIKDEDKGFDAFVKGLRDLPKLRAKVGIQGTQALRQAAPGLTMVHLGAIHEFGAPSAGIPQRSFLRSTADANEGKYQSRLRKIVANLARTPGTFSLRGDLFKLGEKVRADVINRIRRSEIKQDLADSTKRSKARKAGGTVEPALIDDGMLIGSIRAVVS